MDFIILLLMMLGENGVLFDKRQIDFVNCKTKLKFNLIYN